LQYFLLFIILDDVLLLLGHGCCIMKGYILTVERNRRKTMD
jgi:hypothetical protein